MRWSGTTDFLGWSRVFFVTFETGVIVALLIRGRIKKKEISRVDDDLNLSTESINSAL